MFLLQDTYCKINFHLYCSFAFFPQYNIVHRVLLTSVCSCVFVAMLISQIAEIIVRGFDLRRALVIVPTMVTSATCLGIMIILLLNKQYLQTMFLLIIQDFPTENIEEFTIKEKSTNTTKRIIKFTTLTGLVLVPVQPQILDIFLPLNESRPRELVLYGEYFVEEEKYFNYIVCLQGVSGYAVVIVAGVVINMAIIIYRHFCSLITVLGYRMENLLPAGTKCESSIDEEMLVLGRIKCCVRSHMQILEILATYSNCGSPLVLLCLCATMMSLIPTLAEVTDLELLETRSVFFVCSQIGQFFVLSSIGQQLMDTTSTLPERVYGFQWYDYSAKVQKMLLFVIMRTHEPCTMNANGVYVLSVRNFGAAIHAAVSYCMVLRQFR